MDRLPVIGRSRTCTVCSRFGRRPNRRIRPDQGLAVNAASLPKLSNQAKGVNAAISRGCHNKANWRGKSSPRAWPTRFCMKLAGETFTKSRCIHQLDSFPKLDGWPSRKATVRTRRGDRLSGWPERRGGRFGGCKNRPAFDGAKSVQTGTGEHRVYAGQGA